MFESDSNLAKSMPGTPTAIEEKKSNSSYSIIESSSNSNPLSPMNVIPNNVFDAKIKEFSRNFEILVEEEIEKISSKYMQ